MADKNYQSVVVLSKLNAGAWDAAAQTKAIPAMVTELEPYYGIMAYPVLVNVEGNSSDGYVSEKSINNFKISGQIIQEDLQYWLDDFLVDGAQLGIFFATENKWGKGYLTRFKIIAPAGGSIPTFEADIWTTALASMSAPTQAISSAKQLTYDKVYVTGYTLKSLELELFNNRLPEYVLASGTTDNFPNDVQNVDRDGNIKFVVTSDSVATFDDLSVTGKPVVADDIDVVVGSGTGAATISLTRIVVDAPVSRTFELNRDEKLYDISGHICNDNTNPPYTVAIA